MTDKSKLEQDLLTKIAESNRLQKSLQEQAQQVVRMTQVGLDNNSLNTQFIQYVELPADELQLRISTIQQVNDGTRLLSASLREGIQAYELTANSSALGTSSMALALAPQGAPPVLTNQSSGGLPYFKVRSSVPPEALTKFVEKVGAVESREPLVEQVRIGMLRCGLDRAQKGKSALALFVDHDRMIKTPSGAASDGNGAVLILRDSLDRAVLDVLHRCKPQQAVDGGGWQAKILAIGERCGVPSAGPGYFQTLAQRFDQLWNKELSGLGKGGEISRERTLLISYNGLQVLKTLLDGIDEKALRPWANLAA